MRVSVLQEQLAKGLSSVSRAVDSRPQLPVLANVLLATEESRLKLAATNLELTITTSIGAAVDSAGAITLPAKTFTELVNNLSPEKVNLALDTSKQEVEVRCGMTKSNIRGIAATEFPVIAEGNEPDVIIPGGMLKSMIAQTVFAAAKEEGARPVLTGIYTHFDDNILTMSGSDGFRLAIRSAQLDHGIGRTTGIIIPARTLVEVARMITDEEQPVNITLPGERQLIIFQYENTTIASQLVEGRYPDLSAIIPKSYSTQLVVYTDDLLRACKRAEIFARDNDNRVRIMVRPARDPNNPGAVTIVGRSAERGDNEGTLDASIEGEGLEVAFNIRYLIDVLNVLDDEQVIVESNGATHPGVLRPRDHDNFVYVVMPMANR